MGFCGNCKLNFEDKSISRMDNIESLNILPAAYSQPAYNQHGDPDYTEHYFRRGIEVSRQIGSDQYLDILNRSFLALIYSRKGRWNEALTIGEEAFHDALSQGGVIAPICEMVLGAIFMEGGNRSEAKKRLKNSEVLLREIDKKVLLLENNSQAALRNIKSLKLEKPGVKKEAVSYEEGNAYLFRIQMFGPFRIFHRNEEIEATSWRTVKSRDLLAYLAHHDQPVSIDQILEDLWPNLNSDKASAVFHTTLYYLRRLLQRFTDQEIIIHGAKRYQLRPGSILTDRHQFEAIAHSALKKTMTGALANELEAAAMLYHGDYLADLDYHWVMPVQEELKNINSGLKQKLAVYYLKNKIYSRAVVHLRQAMTLEPYSEEVLRLLLITLAKMGELTAVKEQYAAFAQTISEELGLQPSFEITAFYTKLCDANHWSERMTGG